MVVSFSISACFASLPSLVNLHLPHAAPILCGVCIHVDAGTVQLYA